MYARTLSIFNMTVHFDHSVTTAKQSLLFVTRDVFGKMDMVLALYVYQFRWTLLSKTAKLIGLKSWKHQIKAKHYANPSVQEPLDSKLEKIY